MIQIQLLLDTFCITSSEVDAGRTKSYSILELSLNASDFLNKHFNEFYSGIEIKSNDTAMLH